MTVLTVHNSVKLRFALHTLLLSSLMQALYSSQSPLLFAMLNRIIEWFGWEGTFKGRLVQSPCNEQGYLQLDQVAQSSIQPDLECFQGWGIYHLSGQPVPVFHHPHC